MCNYLRKFLNDCSLFDINHADCSGSGTHIIVHRLLSTCQQFLLGVSLVMMCAKEECFQNSLLQKWDHIGVLWYILKPRKSGFQFKLVSLEMRSESLSSWTVSHLTFLFSESYYTQSAINSEQQGKSTNKHKILSVFTFTEREQDSLIFRRKWRRLNSIYNSNIVALAQSYQNGTNIMNKPYRRRMESTSCIWKTLHTNCLP